MTTEAVAADRRILPCGDSAFLVEVETLDQVLSLHAQLVTDPQPGQVDVLAAAKTLLVVASSPSAAKRLRAHVAKLSLDEAVVRDDQLVTFDVIYDGEDLADVAELTGLSIEGVIDAHTGQTWLAAFGGFAPGFVYCTAENDSLDVARRPSPRVSVPARTVSIAGHMSAIYPRSSPGGWQLLGRVAEELWDPTRAEPALIKPGNRVRYRAVRELIELASSKPVDLGTPTSGLKIISAGLQSVITDLGRAGHGDLGVPESGAMDRRAASSANFILGNQRGAAVIENLDGGLKITAVGDQVLAVAGASVPLTVTPPAGYQPTPAPERPATRPFLPPPPTQALNYHPRDNTPFALLDGWTLAIGAPTAGLRAYVAVRGGLEVPLVLGSASADLLSGEGPAPLTAGDVVPVATPSWPSIVQRGDEGVELPADDHIVRITLGPRDDWFDADQIESLTSQRWVVTDRSNRIGLRLEGTPLSRNRSGELVSEGTVSGAIQIPPEGQPVVFLRDHPVTGGYPVIAVINSADLDGLGQLPPGASIGFRIEEDE